MRHNLDAHPIPNVTAQKSYEKSAPKFEGFGSESWRTGANKSTKQKEEKHMYCKPTISIC